MDWNSVKSKDYTTMIDFEMVQNCFFTLSVFSQNWVSPYFPWVDKTRDIILIVYSQLTSWSRVTFGLSNDLFNTSIHGYFHKQISLTTIAAQAKIRVTFIVYCTENIFFRWHKAPLFHHRNYPRMSSQDQETVNKWLLVLSLELYTYFIT